MESEDLKLEVLPPDGHPVGIYLGLAIGGIILGIGTLVVSKDILLAFSKEGIKLNSMVIFQILLMLATAYSSLACLLGLFRLADLQRVMAKRVDDSFKDFVVYARPLIEEIIKQRLIGERISEKLELLGKRDVLREDRFVMERSIEANTLQVSRWGEFLLMASLLTGISVGIFIYLERHPWRLVPYSVIFLSFAWWVLFARYFDLLGDWRSYVIPAIFILVMPSLSIIFRANLEPFPKMQPFEVLYVVFLIMFFYILIMYTYFNYLATGKLPGLLSRLPSGLEDISSIGVQKESDRENKIGYNNNRFNNPIDGIKEGITERFHKLSKKREGSEDEKDMNPKIKKLFPPKKSK